MHPLPNKNPAQVHNKPVTVCLHSSLFPYKHLTLRFRIFLHTDRHKQGVSIPRECPIPTLKEYPLLTQDRPVTNHSPHCEQPVYQNDGLWKKTERKIGQQVGRTVGRSTWNDTILFLRDRWKAALDPWTSAESWSSNWDSKDTKPFFSASVAEYFLWCYTVVIHYCCHLCQQLIQSPLSLF